VTSEPRNATGGGSLLRRWAPALASALLATASLAAPASARDDLELVPATAWSIDYGDGYCALRRSFAAGGAEATLAIERRAPGPYFQVTVASATHGLSRKAMRVAWQPDGNLQAPEYARSGVDGGTAILVFTDSLAKNVAGMARPYVGWTEAQRIRREGEITALAIVDGFDADLRLLTGDMREPMAALQACLTDLYVGWGVDLNLEANLRREPELIDAADVRERVRALVPGPLFRDPPTLPAVLRLVVSAEGTVASCRPDATGWDPALMLAMCEAVQRTARYRPALDANREAVPYFVTFTVSLS
jgi:hypothetical protein